MMTGEIPSLPPSYAALEGILDHLRMQYQKARDWEAAEAVRLAELKEKEERKRRRKRPPGRKPCAPRRPAAMTTFAVKRPASWKNGGL